MNCLKIYITSTIVIMLDAKKIGRASKNCQLVAARVLSIAGAGRRLSINKTDEIFTSTYFKQKVRIIGYFLYFVVNSSML